MIHLRNLLLVFSLFLFSNCQEKEIQPPSIIPSPNTLTVSDGFLDISKGLTIKIDHPKKEALQAIIEEDFYLLFGQENTPKTATVTLELKQVPTLAEGNYSLEVAEQITISGSTYPALVNGLTSLWQSLAKDGKAPKLLISDYPSFDYRSIMLDLARAWHEPNTIKEIIRLCRWYKINFLHLHLTDDSAFTFPSEAFPSLATEGHSYTKAELIALNEYAYQRGLTLVPEIDVPGHSSQFIKKMPELFGIENVEDNPYTISMAREDTDAALGTLIQEIAAVFTYSPYIHIGGDEAFFEGMEKDPATIAYLAQHQLPNVHELFRHFLIRMNDLVKATGKQTILWAGFGEHGQLEIPRDMIVMLWEPIYHHPKKLLAEGFPIINASFKPLYVVNNRKWRPVYIYEEWRPNRWESWANLSDTIPFAGMEIPKNDQVLGATMCAWEQGQINQLPRLRTRVASMSERLWSKPEKNNWPEFQQQQLDSDQRLEKLLRPFTVTVTGLTYPEAGEGNFYEHRWFADNIILSLIPNFEGLHFKYTTENKVSENLWKKLEGSITFSETTSVYIQAFDQEGNKIGLPYFQQFFLKPIIAEAKGLSKTLPIGSWEKLRFEDTLFIALSTKMEGYSIRYTTDGRNVEDSSALYTAPLSLTATSHIRAQLFDDNNKAFGSAFRESYYKLWQMESLTTGKKIKASTDGIRPGTAVKANNGRVTLWEQWGDHKSEENWVQVDLGKEERVSRFQVYTFWDNYRYYQYNIEGSLDGENWTELVDFSKNTLMADHHGYSHKTASTKVRFLKINMLYNSANPGLHLVEFCAWAE